MSLGVADPDLAGPGVMLSFVLSGFMTLLTSFIIERLRAVEAGEHDDLEKSWWFRTARKWAPARIHDPVSFWIAILLQFVRGFSDQQLITGPLLLITAFIKYVPTKDWLNLHTAIHASFFSVVSHLVSMRVLVPYLRKRKLLAYIRHVVICISLVLFGTSSVIFVIHRSNFGIEDYTATRFLFTFFTIYLSIFALWGHFWSNIVRIHASPHAVMLHEFVGNPSIEEMRAILWAAGYKTLPNGSPQRNLIDTVVVGIWKFYDHWIISTIYLVLLLIKRTSSASPLLLLDPLWRLFIFALVALGFDWHAGSLSNSWGFGQILAMMLLLLPVLTLMETFVDQVREDREPDTRNVGAIHSTDNLPQDDTELQDLKPSEARRADGEGAARREGSPRGIQKRPTAGTMV